MEVEKTYIVFHENGTTTLYLLKNGKWILTLPVLSGRSWSDVLKSIDEVDALELISKTELQFKN